MNKNTIFGLLLIFTILIGYSYWTAPSKKDLAQMKRTYDSLAIVRQADSIAAMQAIAKNKAVADTTQKTSASDTNAIASQPSDKNKF